MVSTIRRLIGGAAAVVGTALTLAAPAPAATVGVSEEWPDFDHRARLSFVAAPGEDNRVTLAIIEEKDGYLTVELRDQGAPLSVVTGCSGGGDPGRPAFCLLHELVAHELCIRGCPVPGYGENWRVSIGVDLGDGENSFSASDFAPEEPIPMLVNSGSGKDRIDTAAGNDLVDPGAGTDVVHTGFGNDRIATTFAPDGPDLYDLGDSPPRLQDGDELSYGTRATPVAIRSGQGGAEGEADELIGVERLVGGSGNDRLYGDGGIRRIEGGEGADVLIGGKEKSRIFGEAGPDLLVGGPQRDELRESEDAGSGDDVARGRGGWDLIVLGGGDDRAFAGRGNDRLQGGPGHDALGCGPGAGDTVIEPGSDTLRRCEWEILHYLN